MKTFDTYTKSDYEKLAGDIVLLSKKDDAELFRVLGHSAYDMGVRVSPEKNVLFARRDASPKGISALKGFNYVAQTEPLDDETAEKEGKNFWKRFGKKIKNAICTNPNITAIIDGTATLKDKLALAIPAILAAIGGGIVLGPVYITLISVALAIIIKAGLEAYCEV